MTEPKKPRGRPSPERERMDAALRADGGKGFAATMLELVSDPYNIISSPDWAGLAEYLAERTGVRVSAQTLKRWCRGRRDEYQKGDTSCDG